MDQQTPHRNATPRLQHYNFNQPVASSSAANTGIQAGAGMIAGTEEVKNTPGKKVLTPQEKLLLLELLQSDNDIPVEALMSLGLSKGDIMNLGNKACLLYTSPSPRDPE